MDALFSSASADWMTPPEIVNRVIACLDGIELDPCAPTRIADRTTRAERFYTQRDDGLKLPWQAKTVFVNPPYGRKSTPLWIAKARHEFMAGNAKQIIMLLPARTDTQWFQQITTYPISFVIGRISFVTPTLNPNKVKTTNAPFPSIVIGMGVRIDPFYQSFGGTFGNVYLPLRVRQG